MAERQIYVVQDLDHGWPLLPSAGGDRRFLRHIAGVVVRVIVRAVGRKLVVCPCRITGVRAVTGAVERIAFVSLVRMRGRRELPGVVVR